MATVKPFRAVRPAPEYARQVAALPYDVMGSEEAREMVRGNPYSFLHVDRAEVDLDPSVDLYDPQVYRQAKENLSRLMAQGVLRQDDRPCYYLYRLVMDGREQVGLVGCAAIDDYLTGVIKKHELTRADKEADRIRHVDTLNANTGPIFLACRGGGTLSAQMAAWMAQHPPVCDFVAEDGVGHGVWVVDDPGALEALEQTVAELPGLYIADGHHRCASAVQVGQRRRAQTPGYTGEEAFNYFLSVVFPAEQLRILDYNRLVRDLNGLDEGAFLAAVAREFAVEPQPQPVRPEARSTFGMYLGGRWYRLIPRQAPAAASPVEALDVSVLQNRLLGPILGIADPRTDKRIDFVGGIRGLGELEARVDAGWGVAFSLHPTTLEELMAIADAGMVMPPKSTWFEPKLRSGLFIHRLAP